MVHAVTLIKHRLGELEYTKDSFTFTKHQLISKNPTFINIFGIDPLLLPWKYFFLYIITTLLRFYWFELIFMIIKS